MGLNSDVPIGSKYPGTNDEEVALWLLFTGFWMIVKTRCFWETKGPIWSR
jgi:hypothetical protein